MSGPPRRYTIVGVGLIGGSIARALNRLDNYAWLTGFDSNDDHLSEAEGLGFIDEGSVDMSNAVATADLVIVATPPHAVVEIVRAVLDAASPDTIVTDVASTKQSVVGAIDDPRFVGAHPIAGTEKWGPAAAEAGLFDGRVTIVVPGRHSSARAVAVVEELWRTVGARTVTMDAALHDRVVAAVSHLPHIVAYALTDAVGRLSEQLPMLYGLGAGGFQDTTRVASSNPTMWRDIFLDNRDEALRTIDAFTVSLDHLRSAIAAGDADAMERMFESTRAVRGRVLSSK